MSEDKENGNKIPEGGISINNERSIPTDIDTSIVDKPNILSNQFLDIEWRDNIISVVAITFPSIKNFKDVHIFNVIKKRLVKLKYENYQIYYEYLQSEPKEIHKLLNALSNPLTRFFRDKIVWKNIEKIIKKYDKPIRICSIGTSIGCESYSISILTVNNNIDAQIYGLDLNQDFIELAKLGAYNVEHFSELSNLEIEKYFEPNYSIKGEFKKVNFLQSDAVFNELPQFLDIVLCRNMLIYLNSKHRDTIYKKISSSLNNGGYLIIGFSENFEYGKYNFIEFNRNLNIYKKLV